MPFFPGQGEKDMRTRNFKVVSQVGALVVTLAAIPAALAQCGMPSNLIKPSSWTPQLSGAGHVMRAAFEDGRDNDDRPSMVGMWHVAFTAETADPATAPPGTMIDNALVVWHSDGTEIMNSIRPPQDGNFCLGVWKKTGAYTYQLNHFAWFAKQFPTGPNDPGTDIGPSVGPTHITEFVTLNPDGKHFTGTFTLVAYSTTGAVMQTFTGTLAGTRVTISTKESDLM
jgi:hypothetical protein